MELLASCKSCGAPQGKFLSIEELETGIIQQKKCWHCEESLISTISKKTKNLQNEEFSDSDALIEKSMEFWNDNWEDKYKKWLSDKHDFDIDDRTENYYELVSGKIKNKFEESELWVELGKNLEEFHGEYLIDKEYDLLADVSSPNLEIKPYDSFFLKTFRKNILKNDNQFEEPIDGWILPNNWYSKINDIVRTLFVVKYLDGVKFMVDKIESICEDNDISYQTSFEAKDEGYYAAHMSILQVLEIPKYDWDTIKIPVWIEIQITTSLQDNIRKLLHKYYEEHRVKIEKEDIKWQWNYKSDEFATNYIGHILHYVEGAIMEIRDK